MAPREVQGEAWVVANRLCLNGLQLMEPVQFKEFKESFLFLNNDEMGHHLHFLTLVLCGLNNPL